MFVLQDTSNTVAVLLLEYQSTYVPFLPHHLQNDDCQLILMFTPKSKAYKHLYADVGSKLINVVQSLQILNNEQK